MSYDFHGAHDNTAELHAPLYPRSEETGAARYLNVVSRKTLITPYGRYYGMTKAYRFSLISQSILD